MENLAVLQKPVMKSVTLDDFRAYHKAAFDKVGFPNRRAEDWRYLNLVFLKDFNIAANLNNGSGYQDVKKDSIALVDGKLLGSVSNKGISVRNMKTSDKLNLSSWKYETPFSHIAASTSSDIIEITIEKDHDSSAPLSIDNLLTVTDIKEIKSSKIIIHIEAGCTCHIIYNAIAKEAEHVMNASIDINIGIGAEVSFTDNRKQLLSRGFHQIQMKLEQDAIANYYYAEYGNRLSRNDVHFYLCGRQAIANMYGAFITNGKEIIDNHTIVDHQVEETFSNEYYKGIAAGRSTGIFNGKIYVREDAQRIEAYQQNRNIVLNDGATINTKPQLEIWADDVKCSHGATIGALDENALFFMRARGIRESVAKRMLLESFCCDVYNTLDDEAVKNKFMENIVEKIDELEF